MSLPKLAAAPHAEVELKLMLKAEELLRLHAWLEQTQGPATKLSQENQFFDSSDRRLRGQFMNLRLRKENGLVIRTAKRKRGEHVAGLGAHDEWEIALPESSWPHLSAGQPVPESLLPSWQIPGELTTVLLGAQLVATGGFTNERHAWTVATAHGDEHICLDTTNLPGRVDYELEVETANAVASQQSWKNTLTELGIPWRPQPETKFARFLKLSRS